jgi:hypothetical protein
MNDLIMLRDAWEQPESPSPTAYAAARAGLLARAAATERPRDSASLSPARPGRPGRIGAGRSWSRWLAGGLSLTAVAAAVVLVAFGALVLIATRSHPAAGGHHAAGGHYATGHLSGQQILLAAAETAAARPAGSGRYWHLRSLDRIWGEPARNFESWTAHDGQTWVRDGAGRPVAKEHGPGNIGLWPAGGPITLRQIQLMPADPAALKAWVTRWLVRYVSGADQAHGKPPVSAAQVDIVEPLSELLYETPVRPQVRAAAFQVLASLPGIKRFQSPNGQGLLLPGGPGPGIKMVIDPATSLVRSVTYPAYPAGAAKYKGILTILAANWTNTLPR